MCTALLFSKGVDLFAVALFPGQGRPPSTIVGIRKPETPGYPLVKTTSLCIPSFWHNTRYWNVTERDMTNIPSIAYTVLAKLTLWCAVIKLGQC